MKSLSRFFYFGSALTLCALFTAPVVFSMENEEKLTTIKITDKNGCSISYTVQPGQSLTINSNNSNVEIIVDSTSEETTTKKNNNKQSQGQHIKQPYFSELLNSIANNDCKTLKRLIAENEDLTSTTYTYAKDAQMSVTCLGLVMKFNKIDPIRMMKILIDSGANVDQGEGTLPVSALVVAQTLENTQFCNFLRNQSNYRAVRKPKNRKHKRQ